MMVCRASVLISTAVVLLTVGTGCACGSDSEAKLDSGSAVDAEVPINLTIEALVEACVRLAACDVDRKPELQECVNNFFERLASLGQRKLYERLYHCANQGLGDCKTIRNCLGFASRPQDGQCDATYNARCEGDVAWNCDIRVSGDGWEQGVDCSRGGLKCGLKKTGTTTAAICGGGKCDNQFKPTCQDKKLLKCVGGAVEINDCPAQHLQCRDPAVENCEGTGRSCQQVSAHCEGTKLVECRYDYRMEIDCAKLPGKKRCDDSVGECVGAGTECGGGGQTFFNTCEGGTLVACIDGFKRRFDCKKLGFEGCETATTGYGAYCKAAHVYD